MKIEKREPISRSHQPAAMKRPFSFLAPVIALSMLMSVSASRAADKTVYLVHDEDGKPALQIMFVDTYKIVWDDHDSGAHIDGSAWVLTDVPSGFKQLGHVITRRTNPTGKVQSIVVKDVSPNRDAIRTPEGASQVWNDHGSGGSHDLEVFTLNAPNGYRAIGAVLRGDGGNGWGVGGLPPGSLSAKNLSVFATLRADLVDIGQVTDMIWNDSGSGANQDFSAWAMTYVEPAKEDGAIRLNSGSFVPAGSHNKPENQRAFVLKFQLPMTNPAELRKWMTRASKG